MRIYEGAARQDFEEVFRSIGAFLDQRGMREVLMAEAPDGFIVQGLVVSGAGSGGWAESMGQFVKETLTFLDDDIVRFMDEAAARRGKTPPPAAGPSGYYEKAFRVVGHYLDEQKPRDVFFFEQDGAFVVRMLMNTQALTHHVLAEFTREDIETMVANGPRFRTPDRPAASAAPSATNR